MAREHGNVVVPIVVVSSFFGRVIVRMTEQFLFMHRSKCQSQYIEKYFDISLNMDFVVHRFWVFAKIVSSLAVILSDDKVYEKPRRGHLNSLNISLQSH